MDNYGTGLQVKNKGGFKINENQQNTVYNLLLK